MKLFVYGTLRKDFPNNYVIAMTDGSKFVCDDTLSNFKMVAISGFPAIVKANEGTIVGEVFEISELCLAKCDRLEGYPNFYNREQVTTTNGHQCWVYYLPYVEEGDWKIQDFKNNLEICIFCGVKVHKDEAERCDGNCGDFICKTCYTTKKICDECTWEADQYEEEEEEEL